MAVGGNIGSTDQSITYAETVQLVGKGVKDTGKLLAVVSTPRVTLPREQSPAVVEGVVSSEVGLVGVLSPVPSGIVGLGGCSKPSRSTEPPKRSPLLGSPSKSSRSPGPEGRAGFVGVLAGVGVLTDILGVGSVAVAAFSA